jgi:branched-chain amino acid transport system substrate-binding protein
MSSTPWLNIGKNLARTGAVIGSLCVTALSPAWADVRIGILGPLTGPSAAFGAQLRNGVTQAVEDINKAGGILGHKILLSTGDDASDPKQGVSVANKFVGDKVTFVIGAFNSAVSIPVSEVLQDSGIVQISPASTNPNFTERKLWNVFRTCGRDDQQGSVAAAYIVKNFAGKKIAILHDRTTYGKGLADVTRAALNAAGIKEVVYEGITTGEKDYSAIVSKIRAAGADLVYWGGLHTEGGLIVRQMRDQGVTIPLMGGDGIASAEYPAIAGPGAVGTLMTFGPDPTANPRAAAVVKTFAEKKINPEAYTLYAYAAVQVIVAAANSAGSVEPEKVAAELHKGTPIDTVIGPLSFDARGDRTDSDYILYVWKAAPDGKIIYTPL